MSLNVDHGDLRAQPAVLYEHAGFMAQDSDLWLCRRFRRLHLYNILVLQQKLHFLQESLEVQARRAGSGSNGEDVLHADIAHTLRQYDEAIDLLARSERYQRPTKTISKIFESRFCEAGTGIALGIEAGIFEFGGKGRLKEVHDTTDIMSVATMPKTWLHRLIDRHDSLRVLFKTASDSEANLRTYHYSETRIHKTELTLVTLGFCLLQVIPIIVLAFTTTRLYRLVSVFLLVCFVTLFNALFPQTARETNFGAIASYAAILLVFVGQPG